MNDVDVEARARTLLPFYGHGRATVVKSTVDETEHAGIIVPIRFDGDDDVSRGIIAAVARAPEYPLAPGSYDQEDPLQPGTVVYYRRGVQILGVLVVSLQDIVAYET